MLCLPVQDDGEVGIVMTILSTARGRCLPVGASSQIDGVNFVVPCRHGSKVWLVLYSVDPGDPIAELELDGLKNRTGDHWHIFVAGLPPVFRYGWRIDGPPGNGNRFDPGAVLLDPAATAISGGNVWGTWREPEKKRSSRRSMFFRRSFNWREDVPPRHPMEDSVIYELHVRSFTQHPSSGVNHPGTFAGLIEKIPYLQWLGVTAVEILPIHEFDECDCPFVNPLTREPLRNLWGYNSVAFAAPKAGYAASGKDHGQIIEFREMIRAFHAAGIEVILDVVFNHTGEGDERGRTSSFRGLDNRLYYMLGPDGRYLNFSGCGNTLNCNHPVVRQLLMDCLRYWVADMHVDGLRFDLASIMGRNRHGEVLLEPPVVESIAKDGVLADTKLIAEPWDAVGLYQVGQFPYGQRWSEWNGRYRDEVRRFWRGEPGFAGAWPPVCAAAQTFTRLPADNPCTASISLPATTVSRSMTWFPTTASTMRPTAKRIAMVKMRIIAPIAASKVPLAIPPFFSFAVARPRTSWPPCCSRRACPCCWRATSFFARSKGTITPGVRTTN